MLLELKNLLPDYFDETSRNRSEIWGKELRFEKGEYIKIVAPSGSGKTSLMHFLYGIRNDYDGMISYNSKSIKKTVTRKTCILTPGSYQYSFPGPQAIPGTDRTSKPGNKKTAESLSSP